MAGIGFVLRKLTKRGDIGGAVEAYAHAIFASSGPWILTILTVWLFYYVGSYWRLAEYVEEFRVIILYNFSFSLALTAPLTMLTTRVLADDFYHMQVTRVSNMLIGALTIQLLASFAVGVLFYFFVTDMSVMMKFLAVINFLLISGIWLSMVFISSIKYYSTITSSFIIGMALAVFLAYFLSGYMGPVGMLLGFNCGLAIILCSFLGVIFAEYPPQEGNIFFFFQYMEKYWKVVLMGTCYNVGIWIDKWIMWFAPERRLLPNNMVIYPEYDMSLFIAYLTIIPALALFLVNQETSFFEVYVAYYRGIVEHNPFHKIQKNFKEMMKVMMTCGRSLLILQGGICIFCVLLASTIMNILGLNLVQIGIFRFGILGATFQILSLFWLITLSYFDHRSGVLQIGIFFLVSNALFTWLTLQLGFAFYGYGYFLSTLLTFVVASVIAERYIRNLTYHTFITRNIATS